MQHENVRRFVCSRRDDDGTMVHGALWMVTEKDKEVNVMSTGTA